ncbi:Annexin A2 [Anabarilius grahami]|uniref:Annexin A2 n=1 Tax=Anabarilius grahami TaxID=495550 RepID=A0A3N0Z4S3_ANAGA|nr:Annexin A2 [Anabarilius grahami]
MTYDTHSHVQLKKVSLCGRDETDTFTNESETPSELLIENQSCDGDRIKLTGFVSTDGQILDQLLCRTSVTLFVFSMQFSLLHFHPFTLPVPQTEGMWWGTLGSVRPFPNFRAERDVTVLQAALEKKDVSTVVRILTNRSNAQRQSLARVYKNVSQKELDASLKKVLSGDLQSLILGLMMTPEQFEAHRLRKAMEKENGSGIIDQDIATLSEELKNKKPAADVWIRILTSRHPDHLRIVLDELEFENGQTVEDALEGHFKGVLSGDLRKGLKTLGKPLYAAVVQGVIVSHSEEDLLRFFTEELQISSVIISADREETMKETLRDSLDDSVVRVGVCLVVGFDGGEGELVGSGGVVEVSALVSAVLASVVVVVEEASVVETVVEAVVEGAVEGAVEAVVEAVVDVSALVEAVVEGAVEGAVEAVVEGAVEAIIVRIGVVEMLVGVVVVVVIVSVVVGDAVLSF